MERYTVSQIARLLSHYCMINGVLFGKSINIQETYSAQSEEFPRKHASNVANGKERARKKEELLCMMLDLEQGLQKISQRTRGDLLNHYVYETHIIPRERRGYLRSCLRRLAKAMNND